MVISSCMLKTLCVSTHSCVFVCTITSKILENNFKVTMGITDAFVLKIPSFGYSILQNSSGWQTTASWLPVQIIELLFSVILSVPHH